MKLPLKSKKLFLVSKILCYVFAVLLGLVFVVGTIFFENRGAINDFFDIQQQIRVEKVAEEDQNLTEEEKAQKAEEKRRKSIYFGTGYDKFDDVISGGYKMGEALVAEGSVLLKNDNGALPLGENATVGLFGASCVYPAIAGTGSGGNDKSKKGNDLFLTGFKQAGLVVNEELYGWYRDNKNYCRAVTGSGTNQWWSINDARWDQITTPAKTAKQDAAVFVLARMGGEGLDLDRTTGDPADMTGGDYLAISPSELDVLKHLAIEKKNGTFKHVIVIMNSAYQVCGFDDPALDIDAILWTGSISNTGTNAIGDLIAGKVNPSGRLTDTFWTKHSRNPSAPNFGSFAYSSGAGGGAVTKNYVVYQEGIYMGYRYTETRYEDFVTGKGNAGDFDYYSTVDYPFGYGLSYTDFRYRDLKYTYNNMTDTYIVSVTVTNTGKVAGKEPVQIYLQKPFTDYDRETGIEKAAVELVGYSKTELLGAKESVRLNIEVKGRDFAAYDAYNEGTYILDEGKYYLTAAKDAHDAINNILRARGVDESKLSARGNTTKGDAELVLTIDKKFDKTKYSKSANGTEIVNRFDDADILRFDGGNDANARDFKYTSRTDWVGTLPASGVVLSRTDAMTKKYNSWQAANIKRDGEDKEYPRYEEDNGLLLIDLRAKVDGDGNVIGEIPYDDPMWDEFLDQLTFKETAELVANGFRFTAGLDRLGKPVTLDHNGSNGAIHWDTGKKLNMPTRLAPDDHPNVTGNLCTNYPCNSIVASTFNLKLIEEYGNQLGEDCLWVGYSGLYGPGANLNRNAYNGRNFEYYGEDPYATGMSVAYQTRGMSKRGIYVYLKHCVANDQETNRHGINTWLNEQTMREVYLKAFQIAIEDGVQVGVMTGYNCLGVTWTSAQGFCKYVLHGEFGMTGIAISDFWQSYMNMPACVLGGGDLPDGTPGAGALGKYDRNYADVGWAMRDAAHHILYTVVHSNAMNGVTTDTEFMTITPAWEIAITAAEIIIAVLFGLSALFFIYETVARYIPDKRKEVGETDEHTQERSD